MPLFEARKKLLNLKDIDIENKEWFYLISDDTRNSLSIEGIITSKEEMKAILKGNYTKENEIINYYDTAKHFYGYALELYKDKDFVFNKALIRQVQKEITSSNFKKNVSGNFRMSTINIQGAPIIKPPEGDIELWIDTWIKYVKYALDKYSIYSAIARIHNFFEGIHPFEDGNGRTGRILLNYLLLMKGYPNIIIKGLSKSDKDIYYKALEKGDLGVNEIFKGKPTQPPYIIDKIINKGDFVELEKIIKKSLIKSMDRYICMNETDFFTLEELSNYTNIKKDTLNKRISRGQLIAKKEKNKWYVPKKYFDYLDNINSEIPEFEATDDFLYFNELEESINYALGLCEDKGMDLVIALENKKMIEDLKNFIQIKTVLKNDYYTQNNTKISYITSRTIKDFENSILFCYKISPAFFEKIEKNYKNKIVCVKDPKDIPYFKNKGAERIS